MCFFSVPKVRVWNMREYFWESGVSVLGVAAANFARVSEHLLKREGIIVYTKEGTRVPSLNTGRLACTRWTKRRRKLITWANAPSQPSLKPLLLCEIAVWTLARGCVSLGTQDGPWFPSIFTFLMIYIVMHLHLSDKTRKFSKKFTCCYRCRCRGRGWRGAVWARPGSGPRPGSSSWLRWGSPGPGPPPPHRTWGGSKKLELLHIMQCDGILMAEC